MLVKFSFQNVFSFEKRQDFTMLAGKSKLKSERNIKIGNDEILKFSSIYGANASGKSNFVRALLMMKMIIISGRCPIKDLSYLFNSKKRPSLLEIGLSIDDKIYAYGFEFDFKTSKFHKEWLREITNDKSKVIFERDAKLKTFEFKTVSANFKKDFHKSYLLNKITTNDNILALNNIVNNGSVFKDTDEFKLLSKIYEWFFGNLNVALADEPQIYAVENFNKNLFQDLLVYFDTGIKKISIEEREANYFDRTEPVLANLIKLPINTFRQMFANKKITLMVSGNSTWLINFDNGTISYSEVIYYHEEEMKVPIIFSDESDGTQKIIKLTTMLNSKNNTNRVFVVDELERSLHPLLTWKFIDCFLKINANNNAQLIVSSHETNIMDLDLLRRDEVWFVKKENNASELYSLEEFSIRFDLKLDKAYLDGRFGAVPNFDGLLERKLFNKDKK